MTLRLPAWAATEIEIRAESGADLDDPDVAVVLACWNGTGLTVPAEKVDQVRRGLITLSNACDEEERRLKHSNPFEARVNRHACVGLSNAAWRLRGASCS